MFSTILLPIKGIDGASAALFGALIAQVSSGLLVWRWWQGRHDYRSDPRYHLSKFYRSIIERLVLVGFLLVVGISVLKLDALWLLAGFLGGQLAWALALALWRERM